MSYLFVEAEKQKSFNINNFKKSTTIFEQGDLISCLIHSWEPRRWPCSQAFTVFSNWGEITRTPGTRFIREGKLIRQRDEVTLRSLPVRDLELSTSCHDVLSCNQESGNFQMLQLDHQPRLQGLALSKMRGKGPGTRFLTHVTLLCLLRPFKSRSRKRATITLKGQINKVKLI